MKKPLTFAAALIAAVALLAQPPDDPTAAPDGVADALPDLESVSEIRDALYGLLRDSSDAVLASDYAFLQTARDKKIDALRYGDHGVLPKPLLDLYADPQALRNALYDLFGQATEQEIVEHYATLKKGRQDLAVLEATWQKHLREQDRERRIPR